MHEHVPRIASFLLLSLALVGGLPASDASAQARRAGKGKVAAKSDDDALAQARKAYEEGRGHFDAGRYVEAQEVFERLYESTKNPVLLVSIAECRVRKEEWSEAVASYEAYLAARPDAPDRSSIEQKLVELRATKGKLRVVSTPAGASILVDGVPSERTTPAELDLPEGEHRIVLELDGYEPAAHEVRMPLGGEGELEAVLSAEVAPAPAKPAMKGEQDGAPDRTAFWVATGVSGAALVTSGVFVLLALDQKSSFDEHPTRDAADRGERYALMADVALGVGVVAGVSALVLLLTESDEDPDERAALRLSPILRRDGGGAACALTF